MLGLVAALVGTGLPALAKPRVGVSGVVASSFEARSRTGPELEAELRFKTKRVQGLRAVVKFEGQYFRDSVELEDGYLDYKYDESLRIQLGVNKKRVGLEYEQGRRRRVSPERSFLYQKLETIGVVGRQLNLRVLTKPRRGLVVDGTLGTNGSRDLNALIHIAQSHGALGYGTWGLLERHRVDKGHLAVWAQAASVGILAQASVRRSSFSEVWTVSVAPSSGCSATVGGFTFLRKESN